MTEPLIHSEEILSEICRKLDRVIGLLAIQQCEDDENAKIKMLYELGLDPSSIGAMLGLSANAVTIRMSRIRQKSK